MINKQGKNNSVVLRFLVRMSDEFHALFAASLFYSLIHNETSIGETFKKSKLYDVYSSIRKLFPALLKVRLAFARKCEQSILTNALESLYFNLFSCPMRTVGIYLITYGSVLFITELSAIRQIEAERLLHGNLFIAILLIILSLLFLPIKRSISSCISQSSIISLLGLETSSAASTVNQLRRKTDSYSYTIAFLVGLLCGIASRIVPPTNLIAFLIACFYCIAIFNSPESGILLIAFALPFLYTSEILFAVVVTFMAFIYKFLRGKRHIAFGFTDILLFLTALLILCSGAFTAAGPSGIATSVKYIIGILLAVLTMNLVRSTEFVRKCVTMLCASSTLIVAFDLVNYISGIIPMRNEILSSFLAGMRAQTLSTFASTHVLGVYLTLTLPLILSRFVSSRSIHSKLRYGILFIMLSLCLVYANSALTISILIVACIVVLSLYKRFYAVLILFLPVLSGFSSRLLSLLGASNTSDTGVMINHRMLVWKSASRLLADNVLFGIGIGDDTFARIFPAYALPGTENAPFADSMILQLLICLGIFGAVFCTLTFVAMLRKTASYIVSPKHKDKYILSVCIGLFCGVLAFACQSIFTYTWTDSRIILLFWFYLSLGIASVKSTWNDYIDPESIREHMSTCGTK